MSRFGVCGGLSSDFVGACFPSHKRLTGMRVPLPCFSTWAASKPPSGGRNLVCNTRSHGHAEGIPYATVLYYLRNIQRQRDDNTVHSHI